MFFMMQKYYFCGLKPPSKGKNNKMAMKKLCILLIINMIYSCLLYGQISDDFSSGYFGSSVSWQGDTADFVVNSNGQLQLNASQAGVSVLYVSLDSMELWQQNWEWNFRIRLAFSPSNNNFARFYLAADTSDLKYAMLQGFYLQFGENLSQDAIELFYTDESQTVSVLRGFDAMIAGSFDLWVKLIKTEGDNWQLWIDDRGNGRYQLQGEVHYEQRFQAKAAGFYCKYTVGNVSKFYFDDIYIGPQRVDSVLPTVQMCYGRDDFHTVTLCFSEMVDETVLIQSHYQLEEEQCMPLACEYNFPDYAQVSLFFTTALEEDRTYHLRVSGVRDLAGNVLRDTIVPFYCHKIKRNDVLIHEIMADPTPMVGLPPAEYVELYNRTGGALLLSNWKLQLGKTLKMLPDIYLSGYAYAVIAAGDGALQLQAYCDTVYALSSLSITDDGQELILYNNYDEVIHTVKFSADWHRQSIKKGGGWSLEMMDSQNPCAAEENWDSSTDVTGGTPGRRNSITAENVDYEAPMMLSATVIDSNCLRVHCSETVFLPPSHEVFALDHEINIVRMELVPPGNNSFDLLFDQALRRGVIYQLSVKDSICDCVGLPMPVGQSINFGLDRLPYRKDLIINEILTDSPGSEDADYIEVYNRSSDIIDLKNVKIGSGRGNIPDKAVVAISAGYQLFPQQMVALCKNRKLTEAHYHPLYPQKLLQCDSLPAFANAEGVVHLTDKSLQIIDRLQYTDKMHYSMLTSTDGVALERVHYEGETQDENNWKSAAANVGFGTPGYVNSQFAEWLGTEDVLRIKPEIFSPDNDGMDDFAEVYCRFAALENRVTVAVYAQDGMLVKILSNNELCGNEARFLWDGTDETGRRAGPALYVVKLSYWNLSGKKRNKQAVVGLR